MEELISIIVPIYNVEKYLPKCIKSIQAQTYKNLEIILVDDGSPDGCGDICDDFAENDNRIKVIHKENGGLSDARNAGIDIATGRYLAFVDSDDYISNRFVEELYSSIKDSDADIAICNFELVNEHGKVIENVVPSPLIDGIYDGEDIFNNKFAAPGHWYWAIAWNKLYKSEVFNNLRFEKGKLHEDEYFANRVFLLTNRVVVINNKLYYYVQRKDSIMNKALTIKNLDILDAIYERIELHHKYAAYNAMYCDLCCILGYINKMKLIHGDGEQVKLIKKEAVHRFKKYVRQLFFYVSSKRRIKLIFNYIRLSV